MKEIEQAEFDRLEATLDKSFGRPTLEKEEMEMEKEERRRGWMTSFLPSPDKSK